MMASIPTIAFVLALSAPLVSAQTRTCFNRFGQPYNCGGLNNAARIGIGVAVGVGILLLICLIATMRRKSLQRNFARYRPPAGGLPYAQNNGAPMAPGGPGGPGYSYGQGNNPYAANPPPPMGYQGQQDSSWNNNSYGGGVSSPAATYQPGGNRGDGKVGATGGQNDHEHGYEWEQAREAERLERMQQQQESGPAPPGYDVSVGNKNVVTGNSAGNDTFAPPPGPPPGK